MVSVSVPEVEAVTEIMSVSVVERVDTTEVTVLSAVTVTVSTGTGTVMVVGSTPAHLQADTYLSQDGHTVEA
jgi:NADPH-dependent glutamate synthase beta subunit-like oxidoreductase